MKTSGILAAIAVALSGGCGADTPRSDNSNTGVDAVGTMAVDAVAGLADLHGAGGEPDAGEAGHAGAGFRGHLYGLLSEAAECVTDVNCIDNDDCPGGQRCNETLELPRCQKVACAASWEYCDLKNGDELCKPGHHCVSDTGLSAWGDLEEKPWCVADDCWKSSECKEEGACTTSGDACMPTSTAECSVSSNCLFAGQCKFQGSACVAGATADCQAAELCKLQGDCTLVGTLCGPTEGKHCKEALWTCAKFGKCALVDGECIATTDAECASSSDCASNGACAAGASGACVPASQEHCAQSSECKSKGTGCSFTDGSCVGEPSCDYVGGHLCEKSYNGCGIAECQCNYGPVLGTAGWGDYCADMPCPNAEFLCNLYCATSDGNGSWTGGCILSASP